MYINQRHQVCFSTPFAFDNYVQNNAHYRAFRNDHICHDDRDGLLDDRGQVATTAMRPGAETAPEPWIRPRVGAGAAFPAPLGPTRRPCIADKHPVRRQSAGPVSFPHCSLGKQAKAWRFLLKSTRVDLSVPADRESGFSDSFASRPANLRDRRHGRIPPARQGSPTANARLRP